MVSRQRGFTFVELLIVVALSFLGLLGLLALQIVAVRANGNSRFMTEAIGLAQDKMESLEHTPFATLSIQSPTILENGLGPQGVAVAGGPYTRTTTTTVVGGSVATLRVRVTWTGTDNRAHAVAMNTVRTP